jgi:hypothetical protein
MTTSFGLVDLILVRLLDFPPYYSLFAHTALLYIFSLQTVVAEVCHNFSTRQKKKGMEKIRQNILIEGFSKELPS